MKKIIALLLCVPLLFCSLTGSNPLELDRAEADVEFKPVPLYWAHAASVLPVGVLSGLLITIGGVLMGQDGMIALLTNEADGRDNGLWVVHAGAWERMYPSAVSDCAVYVRKGLNKGMCGGRNWGAVDPATYQPIASTWFCN